MSVLISLSPNTDHTDVRVAWRVLLQPWLWRRPGIVQQLEQQLASRFQHRLVILTSSGRNALYTALQAHNIRSGDEVITQAFTCIAVPAAIKWTGATPIYADIDPNTYNIDPADIARKISRRTKAIIVQHTFGIPGPLADIQQLCQQHGIILIEDCAHALGATYKQQPVGTIGDIAILSFGRDKSLSCVFGGAVVTADRKIAQKVRQLQSSLRPAPLIWIKQQLLHPILFSVIVPQYFKLSLGKILLVLAQRLGFLSMAVEPQEKRGAKPKHLSFRYPGALAYLLENQLTQLNRFTARRRQIAERYGQALAGHAGLAKPPEHAVPSWLRYPLIVKDPDKLRHQAKQQHMLLGDWYNSPLAPNDAHNTSFAYQPGSCPRAEEIARHVVNLPTYSRLTNEQIEEVITIIKSS